MPKSVKAVVEKVNPASKFWRVIRLEERFMMGTRLAPNRLHVGSFPSKELADAMASLLRLGLTEHQQEALISLAAGSHVVLDSRVYGNLVRKGLAMLKTSKGTKLTKRGLSMGQALYYNRHKKLPGQ